MRPGGEDGPAVALHAPRPRDLKRALARLVPPICAAWLRRPAKLQCRDFGSAPLAGRPVGGWGEPHLNVSSARSRRRSGSRSPIWASPMILRATIRGWTTPLLPIASARQTASRNAHGLGDFRP